MTVCLRLGVLLWVLLQGLPAVAGETAKEIERLLDAGSTQRAYQLAESRAAEEAGDPEFDFLYALAAIEVGHPERAVFALERVLFLHPQNDRVRLELARAQFLLGNYPEARTQFEWVLTHRPPTNVREQIKLFLAKINEQEKAVRPSFHSYVNVNSGHDTNINSATADSAVSSPLLPVIPLDETSQELADDFIELEIGGEALRPITKKKILFGKASFSTRDNLDTDEFDIDILGLRGGISFVGKNSIVRVPLQYEQLDLDGEDFRRLFITGIEWERPLTRLDRLAVFGQLGPIEYPDEEFRDVDLALVGVAWTHNFGQVNRLIALGIYYGDENADSDDPGDIPSEYWGRDYVGIYGRFAWNMTPRQAFYASASFQTIEHDAPDPSFGEVRDEDLSQITAGWRWQWRPKWTINVELSHYNNDSNLELYSYDRTQLYGGVRFGFY
jgi:tetratricopeptide (TPR) repeat protein